MTRIIAGFAGSLSLAVPGAGTRPTSDRVREAVFSALEAQDALRGAHVVDLYAGSGALGLEAASRGAASVVLVERAAAAAKLCRENAAKVQRNAPAASGLAISVVAQSVQAYLDGGAASGPWDLAFLDPPYDLGDAELLANLTSLAPLLAPDAVVVVERSARSRELDWPPGYTSGRQRSYGDTSITWLSFTSLSVTWLSSSEDGATR